MKKLIIIPMALLMTLGLFGCADMRGRDVGLATGAVAGGVAGAAITGSGVGAVAGAAVGGTAGYFVGRSAETSHRRYYYTD
ncbi:hypothetical protein BH10PSE19_BH10PSE19_13710 [soil metagenome]